MYICYVWVSTEVTNGGSPKQEQIYCGSIESIIANEGNSFILNSYRYKRQEKREKLY